VGIRICNYFIFLLDYDTEEESEEEGKGFQYLIYSDNNKK